MKFTRLRRIDVIALIGVALTLGQAIPWYFLIFKAGEWGVVDNAAGFLGMAPAAVGGGVALHLAVPSLRARPWRFAMATVGLTVATQGSGQLVGGMLAVNQGSAPGFIGLQWGFVSVPMAIIGAILVAIAALE